MGSSADEGLAPFIWHHGKSVVDCNRHMLEYQLACDVWFIVGPNRDRVGAHRYVLESRSSVFFSKLENEIVNHSTTIDLHDVDPDIFWQFLRYIYCDELRPNPDTVFDLLALSYQYDMVTARDICLRFLHDNLTVPLAGDILETSHIHEDKKLEKEALLFIKNHWEEVVQTPGMGKWCRDCLNKVLTLEGTNISDAARQEVADRWSDYQCKKNMMEPTEDNKQTSLGEVLYVKRDNKTSHRFVLDSLTQCHISRHNEDLKPPPLVSHLSNGHSQFDFTDDASIISGSSSGSRGSMRSQVSRNPSSLSWADVNTVTRFRDVEGSLKSVGKADAISFTVESNIYLYGFGIYGVKEPGENSFRVDTILTRKKKDLIFETVTLSGAGHILPVMFERPAKLEKGKLYTLEIYIHGPDTLCGTSGLTTALDASGWVKFHFSKATRVKGNRTDDCKGQIPRLYFVPY